MALKIKETEIRTNEVIISYPNLVTPRSNDDGGEPKYSCCILIPKSDTETLGLIRDAIKAAAQAGAAQHFNGKVPAAYKHPLRDGDAELESGQKTGDEYKGHFFLNCSSKRRPQVINRMREPITDETQLYGGIKGLVVLNFFAFSGKGLRGVAAGLNAVLKTADGEPLGGGGLNIDAAFGDVLDGGAGDDFDPLA